MVKSKFLKRVLSCALALSLVMAPAIGASASSAISEPVKKDSSSNSTSATTEEAVTVPTTSNVTLNGTVVKSTVSGAYMSKTIPGTVVTTGIASIAAGYGLTSGERPYVRIYDIDAKKSPAAMESLNAAAAAIGGKVCATVNVEFGKLGNGKFSLLSQNGPEIAMAFGIPKSEIQAGYAYAMICVRSGGAIEVCPDLDNDPNTVTFTTKGGLGAFAMVKYPIA